MFNHLTEKESVTFYKKSAVSVYLKLEVTEMYSGLRYFFLHLYDL